jgi:subtilisin family serine protease
MRPALARSVSLRRAVNRAGTSAASSATGLVAVSYSGVLSAGARSFALSRESAAGASLVRELTFSNINRYLRVLHVTPGSESRALSILRAQPGVIEATVTGTARAIATVAQKYYPNDPYYNGFTAAQVAVAGSTQATYHVDPYEENASIPGQWGMHAVRLDYAEDYSQSNNGSGIVSAGALGSSNVKIAVIDSGEDPSHPELASKIAYQKCFVTDGNGTLSTSGYSMDPNGHGTNVSGIAAATSNNSVGYVGSGGAASIYAYRVFPTPDDSCDPSKTTHDAQCSSNTTDIVSAINDAVKQKVNVINLSLGGTTQSDVCTNGVDPDTAEGSAIASAIAANIVVVAAAGNYASGTSAVNGVVAPGCDTGVIAVGASALSDGVANGSSSTPAGSSSSPVEYVASYSNYGSPAAAVNSTSAWGIVAPGGDPSNADATASTTDQLHWIQNIWTTTPYDSSDAGDCSADFGDLTQTPDCSVLIAGTSQATPLVAGAVALLIAANPSYQSPSKMKQLLCSTAHDIGAAHEGCGRLDLYRAMATALGDTNLPASK